MPDPRPERATQLAILAVAGVLAASGVLTVVGRTVASTRPTSPLRATPRLGRVAPKPPAIEARSKPLRLRIPAIGVDAPLVPLGLNADGTLQVPRYEDAGWYVGASRAGDVGPAVIAAHVDSTTGPAVFYRLDELEAGQEVFVEYSDATVGFVVRDRQLVSKTRFPTDRVYRPTAFPELRLVTCAGAFNNTTGSYSANLIVWADLSEAT